MPASLIFLPYALLLSLLIGGVGLQKYARPFTTEGLRSIERKLNRERRSVNERRRRGAFLLLASLILAGLFGWWVQHSFSQSRFGFGLNLVLFAWLLPTHQLLQQARHIRRLLNEGLLVTAQRLLPAELWRNQSLLDAHAVARAMIEQLFMQLAERIVAPLLFMAFAGWPGVFLWLTLCLQHDVLGRRLGDVGEFGEAAHRLHQAIIPLGEGVTLLLLWLTSFVIPQGKPLRLAKTWKTHLTSHPLLNVSAAALSLSLGGPFSPYTQNWLDYGTAKALPSHITKALLWFIFACAWLLVLLGLLALL